MRLQHAKNLKRIETSVVENKSVKLSRNSIASYLINFRKKLIIFYETKLKNAAAFQGPV